MQTILCIYNVLFGRICRTLRNHCLDRIRRDVLSAFDVFLVDFLSVDLVLGILYRKFFTILWKF